MTHLPNISLATNFSFGHRNFFRKTILRTTTAVSIQNHPEILHKSPGGIPHFME